MSRKRKLHLGNAPIGGKELKSRKMARLVTSSFHKIRNSIDKIEQSNLAETEKAEKKENLQRDLDAIGGIKAYQQASIVSTSHFKTSRWVVKTLKEIWNMNEDEIQNHSMKRKLFEVGAINTQLLQNRWLDVRAIDINSQNPAIEERDFFTIVPEKCFDAVVCSMV